MKEAVSKKYSEPIRKKAISQFVKPARESGKREFTISVRELMNLFPKDFSFNRQGQFCSALLKRTFLEENGLELVYQRGPASKRSTTVAYNFRFKSAAKTEQITQPTSESKARAEAHRLVEGLRGLMKNEIKAFGGGEAFLKWVRSDKSAQ